MQKRLPFRQRLAKAIVGKGLIPALNPIDGVTYPGMSIGGRINTYADKASQITALTGWVFAANSAIANPCAAVEIKLYRKLPDGDREEITSGKDMALLELIDNPNLVHTGEQLRQLHFTYMNIVGESYIFMRGLDGEAFTPSRGKLPAALDIFPAHQTQFRLGDTYTQSTVSLGNSTYPVTSFIRDINPDPANPYMGQSIIAASAVTIDMDEQMKTWNQQQFAQGARPSLVYTADTPLDDASFKRLQSQFNDEHTGTANAHKVMILEAGKVAPWTLNQQDLDFLESRKFSRDEILAMFKVSPGIIGSVENVNRSSMEASFYNNAVINVVPRVRQFVRQMNNTLVKVYDPTLELDYVNPVPEDAEMKLKVASELVDRVYTKDEVRDMYGEDPLPNGLGEHIIVQGKGAAQSLEDVLAGDPPIVDPKPKDPEDPDDDGDDDLTESPTNQSKSLVAKQVSSNDFPNLYDDLDIDMSTLGCIMLNTQTLPVTKFVDGASDDLVDSTDAHDHTMGAVAEKEAHVTLLFGLLENGNVWKDKVDTVLDGWDMKNINIDTVGTFDLGNSYAVVAHVNKTKKLVDGHERLTLLPHIQTFSEYKPHMTLAYVKHDKKVADKWVKALGAQYNGKTVKTMGINYGDQPDGNTSGKSLEGKQSIKKP